MEKVICPKCKGNGYNRALIEEGREEVITDCSTCANQGDITIPLEMMVEMIKRKELT